MSTIEDKDLAPFVELLDAYDASFLSRDIKAFRKLHVSDGHVVFFDNHAGCDSRIYSEHERKVLTFFETGAVGSITRENLQVFSVGDAACVTVVQRYNSKPTPGVRTSYFLERERGDWKIRHMHHSFDPNE
jgi:ketosteroid isomerase-like protein